MEFDPKKEQEKRSYNAGFSYGSQPYAMAAAGNFFIKGGLVTMMYGFTFSEPGKSPVLDKLTNTLDSFVEKYETKCREAFDLKQQFGNSASFQKGAKDGKNYNRFKAFGVFYLALASYKCVIEPVVDIVKELLNK